MPTIREIRYEQKFCEGCSPKCVDAVPVANSHFCYWTSFTASTAIRNRPGLLDEKIGFEARA